MATSNIDNDQQATDFALYVRRSGGVVKKIKQLRQGYEFDISIPHDAKPGWGTRVLRAYLANPEGKYVEVTGHS